jgi:glycosyltransferase involved in cell wall biosynthesis
VTATPDTLVVIPAYNEAPSIARVIAFVKSEGWACLVVDDGSRDGTRDVALKSGSSVVSHATNLGVGAALRTGYKYAVEHGYQRVVQCDADGQHRVQLITELVGHAQKNHIDLVIGSRFRESDPHSMSIPGHRRLVMRWLSWTIKRKANITVLDTTSGFKCVSEPLLSEFARSFPANFLGDTFEACLVAAASGYSVSEVPTPMDDRLHGQSSASPVKSIQYIARSFAAVLLGLTFKISTREKT